MMIIDSGLLFGPPRMSMHADQLHVRSTYFSLHRFPSWLVHLASLRKIHFGSSCVVPRKGRLGYGEPTD